MTNPKTRHSPHYVQKLHESEEIIREFEKTRGGTLEIPLRDRLVAEVFSKIATPQHFLDQQDKPTPMTPKKAARTKPAVITEEILDYVKHQEHLELEQYMGHQIIKVTASLDPETFDEIKTFMWDNGLKYFSDKRNKIYGFITKQVTIK